MYGQGARVHLLTVFACAPQTPRPLMMLNLWQHTLEGPLQSEIHTPNRPTHCAIWSCSIAAMSNLLSRFRRWLGLTERHGTPPSALTGCAKKGAITPRGSPGATLSLSSFSQGPRRSNNPSCSCLQVVNGPSHPGAVGAPPSRIHPALPVIPGMDAQQKSGWRDLLTQQGPEAWAKAVREHKGLLLTDTTM